MNLKCVSYAIWVMIIEGSLVRNTLLRKRGTVAVMQANVIRENAIREKFVTCDCKQNLINYFYFTSVVKKTFKN